MRKIQIKNIRIVNLTGVLILIISAWQVICIKQKVGEYRLHLEALDKQIHHEHDSVHTLKAELAYLKSPARLKMLVDNHLHLVQIKSEQIIDNPVNSSLTNENKNLVNKQIVATKKKVAWHYKNFNNKNITTVSNNNR